MRSKRVVITGIGVISPIGIGKDAFWQGLSEGRSGVRPITLFDTSGLKVKVAGEVTDFHSADFFDDAITRTFDRSIKLVISATKLALEDTSLKITEENTDSVGVAIGTTLGSVSSISEFDKKALRDGLHCVNPALFPNTVINSPASQVSIRFGIKDFNTTISTGFTASLDAMNYATDFIKLNRAEIVLAGGVEELCLQTYLAFYKTGFLAGLSDGNEAISCPFDKRRNGIVFGEGACVLALENLDSALERKANVYAEIRGFGMSFDAYRINKYESRGRGLRKAMQMALKDAEISPDDIDYISSAANSTKEADKIETEAIKDVFGQRAQEIPISSIKSMVGECFSVSGAFQSGAAVDVINSGVISATINYEEKDSDCDLDYVINKPRKAKVKNVLINNFGPSGCNSSLIISRYQ